MVSRTIGKKDFLHGLKEGVPIGLGYIPVSFTFGLMAASGGMAPYLAVIMSLTNLTSAGQFAGARLLLDQAQYIEILVTVFIINLRYALMSFGISQKLEKGLKTYQKAIIAFGITDETYAVASLEEVTITYYYMLGLITLPIFGWTFGTILGAYSNALMPESLSSAAGIALYGMFIALMIPSAKKSKKCLIVIICSVLLSCIFIYVPLFRFLSSGWIIILSSVGAALGMGIIAPEEEA